MNRDNLLLIFVKNPELGKCKTRLAATIGDDKAIVFYKNMLHHTKEIAEAVEANKTVYYSSFVDHNDLWPEQLDFNKAKQVEGDLGLKMKSAFENGFKAGYKRICIIGSDCYAITPTIIHGAFRALENKDATIGPSTDGGYYLLGMNEMIPELFEGIAWSTESVTADTIKKLEDLNFSYELLTALTDIDNEEDLQTIPAEKRQELLN